MKLFKKSFLPIITLAIVLFFSSTTLYAQDVQPPIKEEPNKSAPVMAKERSDPPTAGKAAVTAPKSRHAWEVGPELSFIQYKEPDVMSQKGIMLGVGAAYSYHNNIMFKADSKISYGRLDYQNSGTMDNIDDIMLEIRAVGGYDFKWTDSLTITPYLGFGYRYLRDDSAGKTTSTGERGYLRESNYLYSPIGIAVLQDLKNTWAIGMTIEYDIFWRGKQKSHLSDVDGRYNDVENTQNSGYGLRGSLLVRKSVGRVSFSLAPFIKYWSIDRSDLQYLTYKGKIIGRGWEPDNNSTEVGLKFTVGF